MSDTKNNRSTGSQKLVDRLLGENIPDTPANLKSAPVKRRRSIRIWNVLLNTTCMSLKARRPQKIPIVLNGVDIGTILERDVLESVLRLPGHNTNPISIEGKSASGNFHIIAYTRRGCVNPYKHNDGDKPISTRLDSVPNSNTEHIILEKVEVNYTALKYDDMVELVRFIHKVILPSDITIEGQTVVVDPS